MKVSFLLAAALATTITPAPAPAHDGPPFPIVVDRPVGPWLASVWTDPDIGIGTFHVMLEAAADAPFVQPAAVRLGIAPVSGRLAEVVYEARRGRARRGGRYDAEVAFDRGELWTVRVIIDGPAGGGELTTQVEATPDGTLGPIGLVVYAFPFVLVALVWWRAARRRMRGHSP